MLQKFMIDILGKDIFTFTFTFLIIVLLMSFFIILGELIFKDKIEDSNIYKFIKMIVSLIFNRK